MRILRNTMLIAPLLVAAASTALAQGDWNQAEQYYSAEAMAAARHAVQEESGAQRYLFLQSDRLEYQSHEGDPLLLWDLQGWYGGDLNKLWLKSEGEHLLNPDDTEEAELQALYSRAVSPYFDLQAGVRHDPEPGPSTSYGVIGLQGLAPYWFEIDAAAFVSEDGDVSARVETEYEVLLTQRLILQPRVELTLAAQDVEALGLGSGLSSVDAGLRLRYEIDRQFAPYLGVSWSRKLGDTADFARDEGEDVETLSFVAGLRLWF